MVEVVFRLVAQSQAKCFLLTDTRWLVSSTSTNKSHPYLHWLSIGGVASLGVLGGHCDDFVIFKSIVLYQYNRRHCFNAYWNRYKQFEYQYNLRHWFGTRKEKLWVGYSFFFNLNIFVPTLASSDGALKGLDLGPI